MKKHRVGSLLITDDENHGKLVGIFTERDLLKKIDEIQHGGGWEQPVSACMTRPVVTVDLSDLNNAGELMIKKGFRHLPVITRDQSGKKSVAGMVSMRDFFREEVLKMKDRGIGLTRLDGKRTKDIAIGLITADLKSQKLFMQVFSKLENTKLMEYHLDQPNDYSALTGLVLDIDGQRMLQWSRLIKTLAKIKNGPFTLILFDPLLQPTNTVRALSQLEDAKKFAIFPKPVNLIDLFQNLEALSGA